MIIVALTVFVLLAVLGAASYAIDRAVDRHDG